MHQSNNCMGVQGASKFEAPPRARYKCQASRTGIFTRSTHTLVVKHTPMLI